jgi:hypothetical protein
MPRIMLTADVEDVEHWRAQFNADGPDEQRGGQPPRPVATVSPEP